MTTAVRIPYVVKYAIGLDFALRANLLVIDQTTYGMTTTGGTSRPGTSPTLPDDDDEGVATEMGCGGCAVGNPASARL